MEEFVHIQQQFDDLQTTQEKEDFLMKKTESHLIDYLRNEYLSKTTVKPTRWMESIFVRYFINLERPKPLYLDVESDDKFFLKELGFTLEPLDDEYFWLTPPKGWLENFYQKIPKNEGLNSLWEQFKGKKNE